MINNPPPSKGLNIRIPIITPIVGTGFINHGSTLRGVKVELRSLQFRKACLPPKPDSSRPACRTPGRSFAKSDTTISLAVPLLEPQSIFPT